MRGFEIQDFHDSTSGDRNVSFLAPEETSRSEHVVPPGLNRAKTMTLDYKHAAPLELKHGFRSPECLFFINRGLFHNNVTLRQAMRDVKERTGAIE